MRIFVLFLCIISTLYVTAGHDPIDLATKNKMFQMAKKEAKNSIQKEHKKRWQHFYQTFSMQSPEKQQKAKEIKAMNKKDWDEWKRNFKSLSSYEREFLFSSKQ